ncbi:MAG: UDP-N-acetylmuramate dehydrogenase [Pseudomonadota bacterium]
MMAVKTPSAGDVFADLGERIESNAPLARYSWFRTGGPADYLFRPKAAGDLDAFIACCPQDMPITILGVGSNLLIRDGGVAGVVLRLGKAFAGIEVTDELIVAGAAAPDIAIATKALEAGLTGLEFLRGIPGSIGGALAMNAGCYGQEIADCLVEAEVVDLRSGEHYTLGPDAFEFAYRQANLQPDHLITRASLRGRRADPNEIAARMREIGDEREASQPLRTRTGGSTFKNPDPQTSNGRKAWQLIDAAGMRGARVGNAQVSEKHCNFLLNLGDATARDLEKLGEDVRARVLQQTGVVLEWEIRRIGRDADIPPVGGGADG